MAPELLRGCVARMVCFYFHLIVNERGIHVGCHSRSTDIWSLGMILFQLLFGRLPFSGEVVLNIDLLAEEILEIDQNQVLAWFSTFRDHIKKDSLDEKVHLFYSHLIISCLKGHPSDRPSATALLSVVIKFRDTYIKEKMMQMYSPSGAPIGIPHDHTHIHT